MAVRSKQLTTVNPVGSSAGTVYTTPAGYRTIVKNVTVLNYNAAADAVHLHLYHLSTLLASVNWHLAAIGTDGDSKSVETWMVLNDDQHLEAICTHGNVRMWLSGAELLL